MKKILAISLFCLALCGCRGPNKLTISTIDENWKLIGPEYVQYVENDENLTPEYKETKKRTAELFGRLIEEAKRSFE